MAQSTFSLIYYFLNRNSVEVRYKEYKHAGSFADSNAKNYPARHTIMQNSMLQHAILQIVRISHVRRLVQPIFKYQSGELLQDSNRQAKNERQVQLQPHSSTPGQHTEPAPREPKPQQLNTHRQKVLSGM